MNLTPINLCQLFIRTRHLDAVDAGKKTPVDDVPADFHEDAGKDRMGNRLDVFPKAQNDGEQDSSAQRS